MACGTERRSRDSCLGLKNHSASSSIMISGKLVSVCILYYLHLSNENNDSTYHIKTQVLKCVNIFLLNIYFNHFQGLRIMHGKQYGLSC